MGAGVSSLFFGIGGEAAQEPGAPGLGDLPELCAAEVLLRLDAPEICRLARLNHAFRGAAGADFVWEAKLPENYRHLMGYVEGGGDEGRRRRRRAGKKEIYARLSRPVPFDGGTKEFWLEKSKGRVCMALSSKALVITGIDDRRYWTHMPTAESSSEHLHGWDKKPVRFQLATSDGQHALSQCYLDEPGSWVLYHAGDFVVSKPDQALKLKFSMAQIDCTHTKGGLCVDSVLVYPKGFQQEKVITAKSSEMRL